MVSNFYFVKIHKIVNNLATTEATEKINTYLESLDFRKFFDVCLTKFEDYRVLLNKISHRFLETCKLFSGWESFNLVLLILLLFARLGKAEYIILNYISFISQLYF